MTNKAQPWFSYPDYTWKEKTATVIGAGIAGSQVAWHLAKRGWRVTVIERHTKPATEASGNLAGIISPKVTAKPSLGEDFYLQCYQYTLQQIEELQTSADSDNNSETLNWNPVGVLQLAYKERDIQRWKQLQQRSFSKSLLQCVDAETASLIANVEIPYPAVYFPQAGWINPASFCNTLLSHENITLETDTHALDIDYQDDHWRINSSPSHNLYQTEALIICSGKDLNFAPIDPNNPITTLPSEMIAGQTSLAIQQQDGQTSLNNHLKTVLDHEGYITPVINDQQQLLFGATYHRGSSDNRISAEADQQNFDKLKRHLPNLAKELSSIKSGHAAIRSVTPDRLPLLGAVADLSAYQRDYVDLHHGKHWKTYADASYYPNLFISAAYGSRGLTTAGLCANVLASIMNGDASPVGKKLLDALHPARFTIRQLKKNTINSTS